MTATLYSIRFSGKVAPGRDINDVKRALAALFRLSEEAIDSLFSGRPSVLKKGVDQTTAMKYKAAFEDAGALCDIKPMATAAAALQAKVPAPTIAKPSPPTFAAAAASPGASQANPYTPPAASLVREEDESDEFGLHYPRRVGAGSGWGWISAAFTSFRQAPLVWIGIFVISMAINLALASIPFLNILLNLLFPVFIGGIMLGCHEQDEGGSLTIGHLFAGFRNRTGALIGVGGMYFLMVLVVSVLMVGLLLAFGGGVAGLMQLGAMGASEQQPDPAQIQALLASFGIVMLIAMALFIPVFMAIWFAPPLVVLHDVGVMKSLKLSFVGCLRNILPFFVYGIILTLFFIVAAIPVGLGFLVMGPVAMASIYSAYRDIYVD